jgi:predicted nucleic acid-binding protein
MVLLADTGILVRLVERTDPQHAIVRQAVRTIRQRNDRLVTSPQNAAEFWNVCTRPTTARSGLGLSVPETDRRLRIIERLVPILPDSPAVYGEWRSLLTTYGVVGVQAHDARLAAFMFVHGITEILTLNPTDFVRFSGITVTTPTDAVAAAP